MTPRAVLTAVALGGCAYPAEEFAPDFGAATCQLYADCALLDIFDFDSVGACAEAVGSTTESEPCSDYDKNAARDCVEGVEQMTCEDLDAGDWPDACGSRCG